MIRVCFHGAESTGKTALARKLGAELACPVVPEYGRAHAETLGIDFSMDDLLQEEGGVARLEAAGWALEMQPRTAADLALERYARDTYVATYGGAECIFTARIAV